MVSTTLIRNVITATAVAAGLAAGPAAAHGAAPNGSGHGLCFDLNSSLATDSIAALAPPAGGGSWQPVGASNNPLSGGCNLDAMLVTDDGIGDATAVSRTLLFHDGRFMGTVDDKPYSYTTVAHTSKDAVTVSYRWLGDDDPFCCPSGGPTTVTVTMHDGQLTRTGALPPSS
ncbi:LppP/LprE family lipoprotein [Williamsia sterculiae]|uniref:LppP/LprE lipoprotein n=1 Tax=Williamsia sterculiae TaxID=1344003 RepID=A0A1N7DVV1_9NOCA|nr:LppP/LprE family lipoprotein [Williamsia sterculiae]SIR79969.1 LppP/LprE lipoprotein [Williamsia sterculiae]